MKSGRALVKLGVPSLCLVVVASFAAFPSSARADGLVAVGALPNLVPKPASDFQIGEPDDALAAQRALRFTTMVMNKGVGAFDLLMGPPRGPQDLNFVALQCISWISRVCVDRRDVGDLYFDREATHMHFHFASFAHYELRRVVDGAIDLSPSGLAAEEKKESFCMEDSLPLYPQPTQVDQYTKDPPFYTTCNGVNQGISPGWQDEYGAGLAGQQVVIDGVADGEYALITQLDPLGTIQETDKSDNTSVAFLSIGAGGTSVQEH
jgi:hypothetical protein